VRAAVDGFIVDHKYGDLSWARPTPTKRVLKSRAERLQSLTSFWLDAGLCAGEDASHPCMEAEADIADLLDYLT
jgi:hypothetical protein